ncbi:MAG: hypothetical protein LBE48_03610 [Methanomassiliicoccaceae archaeon]|jgi:hypothetical protein|nr:hypothetical protein [Methanomassiliicoccaceae archaeon]
MFDMEELERRIGRLVIEYELGAVQAMVAAMDEMGIPNPTIIKFLGRTPNVVSNARSHARHKINVMNGEYVTHTNIAGSLQAEEEE